VDAAARLVSRETQSTTWLGGDRYQDAAELALHWPTHPTTFALNLAGRPNQYDLWAPYPEVARPGDNLLLVLDETDQPHHAAIVALRPYFTQARRGELVTLRRRTGVIATRRIWILVNWGGEWLPRQP
jgi:hypothetical protein